MKTTLLKSVIMVLVVLFSLSVKAQTKYLYDVRIDDIAFTLDKDKQTATVVANRLQINNSPTWTGPYTGDVVIPASFQHEGVTYDVTSIGASAFYDNLDLTSVTIPNSVTEIGNHAFQDCSSLTSLVIPNSVTEIGNYAFRNCGGLTTITIPKSVTEIGNYAFQYCRVLTSLTIPNSVTEIGNYAFQYCHGLTSLTIPNSVTEISSGAFSGCSGLTSLTIPNSVTEIGSEAFYNCHGLTSLTIPNSVTEISSGAFSGCSGLTSLTIPNSVTEIGSEAFYNCNGLTSLTILNSTIEVSNRSFYGCSGLASATIEITDVAAWCAKPSTFDLPASCTRYLTLDGNIIKDLVIPQSVTSIGDGAFSNCNSLTSVKVEWNRPLAGGAASIPEDVKKNAPLYVPKGTAMMYMSAPGWSEFVNIVEYEDEDVAHYITIRMGDGGVLKQSVEVGQTYTYAVSVDEGWEVNTLTFDGKDMTSLLLDGQFSTPVITGNSELNVVFKQKDTSVKAMPSMSEVKVYASNKNITVTDAEENAPVSVYGINGTFITSAVGNATFTLESGVYVVKVGEETFKVRL